MGAGLAKQIRNQLLSEEQYRTYQEICREYGRANLGKVIRMKTDNYQVYNLFGEDIPTGSGVDTIYAALYKALVSALLAYCKEPYFRTNFRDKNKDIAVYPLAG